MASCHGLPGGHVRHANKNDLSISLHIRAMAIATATGIRHTETLATPKLQAENAADLEHIYNKLLGVVYHE